MIGESVTSIGNYAFRNNTGLTQIKIPDSVTSIGTSAFLGCNNVKEIIIGNGVTKIGMDFTKNAYVGKSSNR